MKLAEALILRKDIQSRLNILERRLYNAARVQEGDRPFEEPEVLLNELDVLTAELEDLITRINLTNSRTLVAGGAEHHGASGPPGRAGPENRHPKGPGRHRLGPGQPGPAQ